MDAIKLRPSFKDYIWGGTRLRDDLGKKCGLDRIAESWELSCHKDGPCYADGGIYESTRTPSAFARFARRQLKSG